ncbi:hypothetical protein CERSUDRAFT_71615 [Gelatoporia subvermispora B]|uniref:DUF6533 domain-containing protein n=1 Tax=Ceriporiopsis subvermispora (strain B) TaxID=914234 RepID=M2R591_CERS8|nr:hypothetical protein CERSUDRAFT_71615 [Gelatoporia subvermispora B]
MSGMPINSHIALVLWDHASSLSKESETIWGRGFNSVTLLFYLNRWITFSWAIVNLMDMLPLGDIPSCKAVNYIGQLILILLTLSWAAFSGIRVFAITGGCWWIAIPVCMLSMVSAGTNLYGSFFASYFEIESIPVLGLQCINGKTLSAAMETMYVIILDCLPDAEILSYMWAVAIATRVSAIVSDVLILLATWYKTFTTRRLPDPLLKLLLRDEQDAQQTPGTMYFLALLALNVLNIIGWSTNAFIFSVEDFTTPLSSLIMSHFLMNLRQLSRTTDPQILSGSSNGWSEEWQNNMGQPLEHGHDAETLILTAPGNHDEGGTGV